MARWDKASGRISGRAGVALRLRRIQLHPVCAECAKRGRTTATQEIDHITPLAMGGTDTDDNVQGLCAPCHAVKSANEDTSHQGAANHPTWLEPSAIPLTILCGPPASGKTTHANEHAQPGDTIIDLDAIASSITGKAGHQRGTAHLNAAIRERNARLGALSRQTHGKAWFIVSAPTAQERTWWQAKLGGTIKVIDPGPAACLSRIMERGTTWQAKAVRQWYAPPAWTPPTARVKRRETGYDGWPVDP